MKSVILLLIVIFSLKVNEVICGNYTNATVPTLPLNSNTTYPATPFNSNSTVPALPLNSNTTLPALPLNSNTTYPATPFNSNSTVPALPLNSNTTKVPVPIHQIYQLQNSQGTNTWSPRIIGGVEARAGEFPGMVVVINIENFMNQRLCGATLITLNHILTAAHCVSDRNGIVNSPSSYIIGGDDLSIRSMLNDRNRERKTRTVTHIFVNTNYSAETLISDIAVMRLRRPFRRTLTFYPVPRSTREPTTGLTCQLAGWGLTREGGDISVILQKITISVIDFNSCQQNYFGYIPNGSFCAGVMTGGKDACKGDSGGSLICNGEITGTVSFGYGCGRPNYPSVYVDVSQVATFIDDALKYKGTHSNIPTPKPRGAATKSTAKWMVLLFSLLVIFYLPKIIN